MSVAIVGTGTGVGKTVVSAVLLARWADEVPLAYWKPVATGSRDERDSATVGSLAGLAARVRIVILRSAHFTSLLRRATPGGAAGPT